MPVCPPVFFTPIYPYYNETYVIREQPLQQFIFVDRPEAEPEPQPVDVEQGPPVRPADQGAIRQAAAGDDQPEQRRGVAHLPEDLLHQLMVEGTELFRGGDYPEAAKRFFRVTMADRLNADATLAYAVARFATGDYQVASLAVRRGVLRFPEVVDSAFDIRARYGDPKGFDNHLVRLETFVRENPDSIDGWVLLGFVQHFSGRRDLAAETFKSILAKSPGDAALAEVFLEAKPLPPADELMPEGGVETGPATQAEQPLPSAPAQPQPLITIE